jgi:hypothetical protein
LCIAGFKHHELQSIGRFWYHEILDFLIPGYTVQGEFYFNEGPALHGRFGFSEGSTLKPRSSPGLCCMKVTLMRFAGLKNILKINPQLQHEDC